MGKETPCTRFWNNPSKHIYIFNQRSENSLGCERTSLSAENEDQVTDNVSQHVLRCLPYPPDTCMYVRAYRVRLLFVYLYVFVIVCVCSHGRSTFFFVLTAIQVEFDGFSELVLSTGLVIVSHVQLLS